ncbi:MAG: tyrosine-type recombinase/integrase [Myxococcales bacterium]|nr:tyrosine-type recombinase/integrase [Myxococcales bacterium]
MPEPTSLRDDALPLPSPADLLEDDAAAGAAPLVLWTNAEPRALVSDSARAAPSPELVAFTGARAAKRTIEFLTANIRNAHTRRAYHRAARRFLAWSAGRGLTLDQVESPDVAAYVEELARSLAPLSVKQHLAALKHWMDWLVTGHVLEHNPAQAVRGPRYSQTSGKTPVLEKDEARRLLASIDASTVVGARDKALLAVMLFSFARVGAVVAMRVRDYRGAGTPRASFLLHEKNGKDHAVPAHHLAAEYLDAYLALSGLGERPDAPLWQSAPRWSGVLSGEALSARATLYRVKRRCEAAGLPADVCNHSFRATGITLHQDAGGDLEAARQIAGHANIKTTQLYNRSGDRKRKAEVERVQL